MLKTKRGFSLILAVLMLLAMAMTASAAWDGTTAEDPVWNDAGQYYEIATPEQLAGFRNWINTGKQYTMTYHLTANIDLGGNEWEPIGAADDRFRGTFDGNNHIISNFKIITNESRRSYAGFFGNNNGGTIENVGLVGFKIEVTDHRGIFYAGGLVGYNNGGTITNCFVVGSLSVNTSYINTIHVGGFVGYNNGGVLSKNYAAVEVYGQTDGSARVGGFAGTNGVGNILKSYSTGNVTAKATGTASMTSMLGGFAGLNYDGSDTTDCYATGNVTHLNSATITYVGGFVGSNQTSAASIATSYSYGTVTATATGTRYWGGFAGRNDSLFNACNWYNTATTNPQALTGIGSDVNAQAANVVARLDMSSTAIKSLLDTQGWDFDNIWCYAALDSEEKPALRAFFSVVDASGVGTEIKASTITLSPSPLTIDGAGSYTITVNAAGFTDIDIDLDDSGLADGVTASAVGNVITIDVDASAAEMFSCLLGATVNIGGVAQAEKTVVVKTAVTEEVVPSVSGTPDDFTIYPGDEVDLTYDFDPYTVISVTPDGALGDSGLFVTESGGKVLLTGTAEKSGTYTYVVRLKGANGVEHTQTMTVTVQGGSRPTGGGGGSSGCNAGFGILALLGLAFVYKRK